MSKRIPLYVRVSTDGQTTANQTNELTSHKTALDTLRTEHTSAMDTLRAEHTSTLEHHGIPAVGLP